MPNNLKDALIMDLDSYPLRGKDELKMYLRWLIGEACIGKDGDTNAHKYTKKYGIKKANDDIRSLIYKGENILDFNMLANKATDAILNNYLKSKNKNNNNNNSNNSNKIIMTFDDVMIKTLTYYKDRYNYFDKKQTFDMAKVILNDYFINKHVKVFSSKNGTRDYVLNVGEDKIKTEISNKIGFSFNDIKSLINNYSIYIVNIYMSKNNIENISDKIIYALNKASLNDKQKEYLISEFNSGNISVLKGYVPNDLIIEYIKYNNTSNFSK